MLDLRSSLETMKLASGCSGGGQFLDINFFGNIVIEKACIVLYLGSSHTDTFHLPLVDPLFLEVFSHYHHTTVLHYEVDCPRGAGLKVCTSSPWEGWPLAAHVDCAYLSVIDSGTFNIRLISVFLAPISIYSMIIIFTMLSYCLIFTPMQ